MDSIKIPVVMSLNWGILATVWDEIMLESILDKDFKDITRSDCRFLREHVGGLRVILLSVVVAMAIWLRPR